MNGEELTFNFNESKDLDLWYQKAFNPKEVNVTQELYKEGYHVETLDSHTYSMPNMKNKEKEILNAKVQVDKGKKSSRLLDCSKCFSKNSHTYCNHANSSLFDDEDDLEIGQSQNMMNGKRNFSPWKGISSFSLSKMNFKKKHF